MNRSEAEKPTTGIVVTGAAVKGRGVEGAMKNALYQVNNCDSPFFLQPVEETGDKEDKGNKRK